MLNICPFLQFSSLFKYDLFTLLEQINTVLKLSKLSKFVKICQNCQKLAKKWDFPIIHFCIIHSNLFFKKFINYKIVKANKNCQKLTKCWSCFLITLIKYLKGLKGRSLLQNQKWLTHSVTQWVSDKVTY